MLNINAKRLIHKFKSIFLKLKRLKKDILQDTLLCMENAAQELKKRLLFRFQ